VAATALSGCTAVLLIALVPLFPRRGTPWGAGRTVAAWSAVAALPTLLLALPLHGTKWPPNALVGDAGFRTRLLTRMVSSALPVDMTYAGVPGFYPPGWFWVVGRIADLLGRPGWAVHKPALIATAALTAGLAFTLWSQVVARRHALPLATATALVGCLENTPATEPYSWCVAALMPPVAVLSIHALGNAPSMRHRRILFAAGIFLGLGALVYTLLAVLFAMILVVAALNLVVGKRRGSIISDQILIRTVVLRLLTVGLVALPIALLFWGPYLVAAVRMGYPVNSAQHYLPELASALPLPMLEFTPMGLASLLGTLWLLSRARDNEIARSLLGVVAGSYIWYLLSLLAVAVPTTLLPFRVTPVLQTALVCAAILGCAEAGPAAGRRWGAAVGHKVVTTVVVMGLIGAIGAAQGVPAGMAGMIKAAYTQAYPTGGRPGPAPAGAGGDASREELTGHWTVPLSEGIARLADRPPESIVVASTYPQLFATVPYWGFTATTPQYSNPLGDLPGRIAEIRRWAAAPTAEELQRRLDTSPYRSPDVFVMARAKGGYTLTIRRANFPLTPEMASEPITFSPALFPPELFARENVGPYIVLSRVPQPLGSSVAR
jgi:galactan 5-O-arabinofuranosyltransferase